jgi:acetyl esterase/lipase
VNPNSRDVLTRRASPPDLVLSYGPRDDQIADLRLPKRTGARLVVLLHGGFWRAAWDRTHTRPMADALASSGFAVAAPEYARTGDGGGWSTTFDDVALAVDTLPAVIASAVSGTVDRAAGIVLAGHSAGGQLALWCASGRLPELYAGVVALAPVADLTEAHRLDLDAGAVQGLLGASPSEAPERYDYADPCRLPAPALPVVVVHGVDDATAPPSLSQRYAAHSGAALRLLAGVGHFDLIDPQSTAWPVVLDTIAEVGTGPAT